jgi:MOSC domain-containing protein YiiM
MPSRRPLPAEMAPGVWPFRVRSARPPAAFLMSMRLISLNVGLPRVLEWHGQTVTTGIFKSPVAGRVQLSSLNLHGDRQADLTVHGGADKAVYVYPSEHYPFWRASLALPDLPYASFGENFTVEGLLEPDVHLGDIFRIGSAELIATQPRLPCYKLGVRFDRADMPKLFLASRRTGFYLRVVREGEVGGGDTIELIQRDPRNVPVTEVTELYVARTPDPARTRRVMAVPALPASWRDWFAERLPAAI